MTGVKVQKWKRRSTEADRSQLFHSGFVIDSSFVIRISSFTKFVSIRVH
jgi:hypothetical protein